MSIQYFDISGHRLYYRQNGETVVLEPWGKDSLRVRAGMLQNPEEEKESIALLSQGEVNKAFFEIRTSEMTAMIRNGRITAELEVLSYGKSLQITYRNDQGKLLLREISFGHSMRHLPRLYKPLQGRNCQLKVSFEANPGERIYGMGQQQLEYIDLAGCNVDLSQRNTLISIPFYISSLGYGFLWHNASVGSVHFGKNTIEWNAQNTEKMDYWITAGDSPKEILQQFTAAVGRPPMMPEYGLGFWQCKLRYYSQEQVLSVAREYKKRGVPLDVIVIDYYHWPYCGDYRFDPEFFPDPEGMIRELHEMGVEVMVSVWPQIDFRSENYQELKQQGLLVRNLYGPDLQFQNDTSNCVFLDVTNPRARKWCWEKLSNNYADLGIRTFWLDEAEPEFGTYEHENYRYFSGLTTENGNLYPREFSRMIYEGQKELGQEDTVHLVRSAWTGSQRYGALVWSGDVFSTWEELRRQIRAGLSMGLSGIPWWTCDIGGFNMADVRDPAFHELLVRWFEFGAFCPVMRLHGNRNPHTEIYNSKGERCRWTGADNEIWSYGEENYRIFVKYIMLREALRDYTRSLMAEASGTGAPLMRPLFYEFPDDPKCWDISDSYCFGPDILVSPVTEAGVSEKQVYLPAGCRWREWASRKLYDGGRVVSAQAPKDVIPVFIREETGHEVHAAVHCLFQKFV